MTPFIREVRQDPLASQSFAPIGKLTNFDALMNAGLNVPGSLTQRIGGESGKKRDPFAVRYLQLKKNYTSNHLASAIIAIDERNKGLAFALPSLPRKFNRIEICFDNLLSLPTKTFRNCYQFR